MRRSDTKENTYQLIEKLRSAMPDAVLRTTVIAGFPGETDKDFTELVQFIKWAEFDALGCFTFWPEFGTAAAKLPGQIDKKIKQQRAKQIMLEQQRIAFEKNRQRIGEKLTCLVDEIGENAATGRYYGQAPHIDGCCHIKNCKAKRGDFIRAKVIDACGYDLIVSQI